MAATMPRHESDPPPSYISEDDRGAWRPVRRLDLDLAHIVEEGVEPRTSDDPDLGGVVSA